MATYRFGAVGKTSGREARIEFTFEDDQITSCIMNGLPINIDIAPSLLGLNRVCGPGYVPRGGPGSRLNALNFLRWEAFDREPEIFGDLGPIEVDEPEEGMVY
jgi:hypothetical protein